MNAHDPENTLSYALTLPGPSTSPMAAIPLDPGLADAYDDLADATAGRDYDLTEELDRRHGRHHRDDPYPTAPVRYDPWQAHRDGQQQRALDYLDQRRSWADDVAQRRAAVILNAEPYSPAAEQTMGIRATWGPTPTDVTCRLCGDTWACIPENPLFEPLAEGGLCFGCVLTDTRGDAQDHVLEGVIVAPVPREANGRFISRAAS